VVLEGGKPKIKGPASGEGLSCCVISNEGKSWALVAHAYNPSYSGDRDQEDLKKIHHKKRLVEWLKV
jgi:hypothetical protein